MRRYFGSLDEEAPAAWYVSTLTPGLHGKPILKRFESAADALDYARARAKAGPDLKNGGKAYYVIAGAEGELTPDSEANVYRVLRATQLIRTRSGMETYSATVLLVQKRNPKAKNPRQLWIPDMAHTVQLIDRDREEDRRRQPVSGNVKYVREEDRAQIEKLGEKYRRFDPKRPKDD